MLAVSAHTMYVADARKRVWAAAFPPGSPASGRRS
jgi:hypothetical protein